MEQSMEKIYCTSCGKENSAAASFCNNCGTPLKQTPVQPVNQPTYQQPYQQPEQQPYQQPYQAPYQQPYQAPYQQPYQTIYQAPPKTPGKGFGIAAMVLGIVGVFYAFAFLMGAISELEYYNRFGHDDFDIFESSVVMGAIMISSMPILGIVFGTNAKRRGYQNGISQSGIVLGTIGCIFILIALSVFLSL